MNCNIQLPDGNIKRFSFIPKALDVAKSISPSLAKQAVAVLINKTNEVQDIRSVLKDGDHVQIISLNSDQALDVIRHSAAHVMAQAVQKLWPSVRVTIGPVIKQGFYYDFDTDMVFSEEDLLLIEKEMRDLIKSKQAITKEFWTQKDASDYFEKRGELLKKQIIQDLNQDPVSVYKQGAWLDLCKGPHLQHLGHIGAIKILSQSGAYWRGDSKNKQLKRIYGTACRTAKELQVFLKNRDLAKELDHRKIGHKQQLFWFSELAPGSPFFTSSGAFVYHRMQACLREKYKEYQYQEVISPQIFHSDLFKQSGHLAHFKSNMYAILDTSQKSQDSRSHAFLKPMNCPGHCLLYKKDFHSYKDLPWRVADFGRLHRNEPTGSLQGLTRVNSFCQDDAHIFCRLDQLSQEIQQGLNMLKDIYNIFDFKNYSIKLSTRPEKRMGEDKIWDQAEQALSSALKSLNLNYEINPGDGAFYGPKLDIEVQDSFERFWQLGTFQCDFNLPKAFDLTYTDKNNTTQHPVMIHRACLGSLERFIGLYLEHVKGRLPLWLSFVQVVIFPLSENENVFCVKLKKQLEKNGINCKIDSRNETLSYKIRESQNQQIPYMLAIGKKELQSQKLSVRLRTGDKFSDLSIDHFSDQLAKEIKSKSNTSFLLKPTLKA